ncbi:MAG TPA: 50S ribosomal protein L25 [Tepidisphaeraceae bacterium]|nr:50S ribosomal protein L25 [Tepidisphaeraceae bacterium]
MAQTAQVTAKARPELGSRANKRLRDAGMLPGVIYGHKEAVVPVTLPKKEVVNHLDKGTHLFELGLDGKSETVLVKEVQYDHLGLEVLHVDFARVSLDEEVDVTVPLELRGEPKGEKDGGVLQQIVAELELRCRVTDIPQSIRHDVSELALNDEVRIKDLKLPPNVRALQDEDQIVAAVREVQEETAAAAEGDTAEPEVIGKKPEEGAEAEEAK